MTINARTFDGWNIDNETYDGHRAPPPNANPFESVTEGTDKPFFAARKDTPPPPTHTHTT
jgi:hypothetical protein